LSVQDLGSIGELVAAIATVITLIYLAVQIRANTAALKVESRRFESESSDPFIMSIVDSPEVAKMFISGLRDANALTPEDYLRFALLLGKHVGAGAMHYDEFQMGHSTPQSVERRTRTLSLFLATAGGRKFWADFKHQYPEPFQAYVDAEIFEGENG
jgi:hypothetical protein